MELDWRNMAQYPVQVKCDKRRKRVPTVVAVRWAPILLNTFHKKFYHNVDNVVCAVAE